MPRQAVCCASLLIWARPCGSISTDQCNLQSTAQAPKSALLQVTREAVIHGQATEDMTAQVSRPSDCPLRHKLGDAQLASHSEECGMISITDLQPYQHGIVMGELFAPLLSSHPLSSDVYKHVSTAVIYLHGGTENAGKLFCGGRAAAIAAGEDRTTLTIAPWFGNIRIASHVWSSSLPRGLHSICYHHHEWYVGADSWDSDISSFTVLDAVMSSLRRDHRFPNLENIVIAGFSGGCQLASRWLFFSDTAFLNANTTAIIGGCQSYLYLDKSRPVAECTVDEDTGVDHRCSNFTFPDMPGCPQFNDYKNGLNLNGLEQMYSYFRPLNKGHDPGNSVNDRSVNKWLQPAFERFPHRDVRFLAGSKDTCNCRDVSYRNPAHCFEQPDRKCHDSYPDAMGNSLPPKCENTFEGSNRLQRMLNYVDYLQDFYARRKRQYIPPIGFFEGRHDSTAFATSDTFRRWVWGKDA